MFKNPRLYGVIAGELRNMGGAKARFAELQRKKEVLEMELNAIEDRKKNSRPAQLQSDIDTYKQVELFFFLNYNILWIPWKSWNFIDRQ